ncbi:PiggyBac transposable element-derived protein 2 [Acipenser ruthenus]|uniref:PiggyBac transposable element-derived protein 2 n=1 Tax=Acipenser ruthenus TaxID=7906 RepID=A0A444TZY4_ACIRT|nr:PiggyBac transposable element-derived protein 2 [Acipenser ruthenus]
MGGVDKLDQLISLYRTEIKSRKWTLRMITHGFDVAVVNSWLEYRRDAQHSGIPNKEVLDLLHFRMNVAECLVRLGKPQALKKRGQPSIPSTLTLLEEPPLKQGTIERRSLPKVQKDLVDHMPNFDDKKEATRCKQPFCTGKIHVFCDKCKVHLCFVPHRNCFKAAHRK